MRVSSLCPRSTRRQLPTHRLSSPISIGTWDLHIGTEGQFFCSHLFNGGVLPSHYRLPWASSRYVPGRLILKVGRCSRKSSVLQSPIQPLWPRGAQIVFLRALFRLPYDTSPWPPLMPSLPPRAAIRSRVGAVDDVVIRGAQAHLFPYRRVGLDSADG
jgi:hypothetical protein